MRFPTLCAEGERLAAEWAPEASLGAALVLDATFRFEDQHAIERYYETGEGYLYGRYSNPTVRAVEKRLARLEGAEDALLFASGMAAIATTLLSLLRAGDRVAAQRGLYGGTVRLLSELLPGLGIETVWLDLDELGGLSAERLDGCRLLYLETPVNPTLRVVDLERAAAAAKLAGIPTVVDGTFATPALQQPLSFGCSLVLHSCTKYLGGHGDLIGGAVAGSGDLVRQIEARRRLLGGTMSPMTAYLLQRGLRTLALRMKAHSHGAAAVAEMLRGHPRVRKVHWPGLEDSPDHELARRQMRGFGGMVGFEIEGGLEAATRVHDRLRRFTRAASLGAVESLVSIPARMSHRGLDDAALVEAGIAPGLVRLSVGLEAPQDLVDDLRQALDAE